jgi:hypothetical protein
VALATWRLVNSGKKFPGSLL